MISYYVVPKKGVFWVIGGELLAFPFDGTYSEGIAKSGDTYNHKKLWKSVCPKGCNKPYNYYPRGRVEVTKHSKTVIYMSPCISLSFLSEIKETFNIADTPRIIFDHSEHYHCWLDSE